MKAMRHSLHAALVAACVIAHVACARPVRASAGAALPSDAEIRRILAERVDAISAKQDGFGIVVGVVGPQGRRIVSYGHPDSGDARPLDGSTVFEIGSVGKTFTALLLADMVRRGEVALTAPVAQYLPDLTLPTRNGRAITLLDLATHTSGLPFMPDPPAAAGRSAASPYTEADLRGFLAGYALPYDIGTRWEYSNLGYWILGQVLASRAGSDFESLLLARVIAPLKLAHTGFVFSAAMKEALAPGHDAALQPAAALATVPMYGLMPAAGSGLYSTVDDLSRILAVAMGYEPSPLRAALAATLATSRPIEEHGNRQALGWTLIGEGDDRLVFRDGGTLGYASCVVWDPAKRVGVVVLSNQVTGVADIARHLLRPEFPLERPAPARHVEIALDTALLDRYAGRYDAPGEGVFRVVRDGDHLTMEFPAEWGLPALRIRPESAVDFFAAELPLRVSFQKDAVGRVSGIIVYPPRGQKGVPASRVDPEK